MPDTSFPFQNPALSIEERARDLISLMNIEEKVSQLMHNSRAVERLNIPEYYWWNECLHGVARAGKATIFPQAIAMAAAFDEDLMYRVADAISDEARAKFYETTDNGIRGQYRGVTFWTPTINIFRDPRWSRGQESYGEDPFLTSRLAVRFVQGLQQTKNGIMKIAACAKHFAAYSGPAAVRHQFNAVVSEKDLRETYLPAFKALVKEADVESVMGAYNRVNGEVCCGNKTLLQDILRDEWGFTGHVVSDYGAITDFHEFHKVTKNSVESAARAHNNGCELDCDSSLEDLLAIVEKGLVSEETIDAALMNVMKTRIKLGLFDPPENDPWRSIPFSVVDSDEHRALAREAAVKSMVLLKNSNNVLPLSKDLKHIYLLGPNTANIHALLGDYYGLNSRIVTPLEGIIGAVSNKTSVDYRPGALLDRKKLNPHNWAAYEAGIAEVSIFFCGLDNSIENEEGDAIASAHFGDRVSIDLPDGQLDLLYELKKQGKPIVAVVFGGCPINISKVHELADAVIWAWYPGEEGGNAIADVIFGDKLFSGKLPLTFPQSVDQLPAYDDYSMKGRTYRYMKEDPLYPFGFGLTYSDISIDAPRVSSETLTEDGTLTVTVSVKNIGSVDIEEIIQLYIHADDPGFDVPLNDLRGFQRIKVAAGSSTDVEFTLRSDDFRLFNNDGEEIWHKGNFTISVGNCSPGKRGKELGAAFANPVKVECV